MKLAIPRHDGETASTRLANRRWRVIGVKVSETEDLEARDDSAPAGVDGASNRGIGRASRFRKNLGTAAPPIRILGRDPRLDTRDRGVRDFWDIWDGGRLLPPILASVTAAI